MHATTRQDGPGVTANPPAPALGELNPPAAGDADLGGVDQADALGDPTTDGDTPGPGGELGALAEHAGHRAGPPDHRPVGSPATTTRFHT